MNDEDLLLLSKQLHLPIPHLQKLPLFQISSLKMLMQEPTMLLWESEVSMNEIKEALVSHDVSLSAKDALYSTVIYALSSLIPDIYKYNSNDFQRLLNAISKTPETKIVDVAIMLAVWRYVSLIKRNAESHRQEMQQQNQNEGHGHSREKARLSIKDIANLFEVEQDLHHVITSNLLYGHIKKCIKEDGRYTSVRNFFTALSAICNIYLSEEQGELLSHILMETGIWLHDSETESDHDDSTHSANTGVIDLHVLMQVVYYAIFKTPLVLPSSGNNSSSGSTSGTANTVRSAGNNSYVSANQASLSYNRNNADRVRNMERGQGGASVLSAFSDVGSVMSGDDVDGGFSRFAAQEEEVGGKRGSIATQPKVQNLLRAVYGHWAAIERCISVVMLKSFQNVLQSSRGRPDIEADAADPAAQMREHHMYGLNIVTRELLTIAIQNSSLPVTRADVHEVWKYIIQMKQREGKLSNELLSIDDQKCSLEEVKGYILKSQRYLGLDSGDQVERSTISRLMRDVDKPPMRGSGCPHPNSLELNKWVEHEKSELHAGGNRRDATDYSDQRLEKSNVYMKIQQRLQTLLSKNSQSSRDQFDNFLRALCDGDLKAPVVLVTRGNFVEALKEVGVRVNKAEGDTVWSEAVTDLCDSHSNSNNSHSYSTSVPVSNLKPTDNLSVRSVVAWLGLSIPSDWIDDAIAYCREKQQHAYSVQQQRRLSHGTGVKQVAYPVVSSPERPVRRLAGGGSFKPELHRGSEIFPSEESESVALELSESVFEPQGFSSSSYYGDEASSSYSQPQTQSRVSFAGADAGADVSGGVSMKGSKADSGGSVSLATYSESGGGAAKPGPGKPGPGRSSSGSVADSLSGSAYSPPESPARRSQACSQAQMMSQAGPVAGSRPTPRNNMSQLLADNTEADTRACSRDQSIGVRGNSGPNPSSTRLSGSSIIEPSNQAVINTRSQFSGSNIRNLLAPAADYAYNDREPSQLEEETGGELSKYEIIAEMNKQKPMVAFLFRRLGGANNSNSNASTSSRASQFNIKAIDFAEALISPPLSLPLSLDSAWELVCEMLRCSVNSSQETTTITYRDIMDFLENSPTDVVEEAYQEAKNNAKSSRNGGGGGMTAVISPTKAQAISYREEKVRRILIRQLIDSKHVQGDRLRMLSLLHPLRVRLRNMQHSGHTSSAGSSSGGSQRGQHGRRGEGFGSTGHTSYHTSWDTPDYCTVSELSKLLQSVDIIYTETELKYICNEVQVQAQSKSGSSSMESYATEVGVKLGNVVLYLSNLLIGNHASSVGER